MVIYRIIFVFSGGYNCILYPPVDYCIRFWYPFLYNSIHNDMLYYLQKDIVRRSGARLCIYFVYHFLYRRNPVVLSWYFGAIFIKNIYGSKKTTYLYRKRAGLIRYFAIYSCQICIIWRFIFCVSEIKD